MRAVVVGPGRIGLGFVGQLLRAAGHDVCFIGRGPVVERLANLGRYTVRLVGDGTRHDIVVDGVTAIPIEDGEAAAEALAGADLIATAVGASNLAAVAPLLARGIGRRSTPVNVLAFENLGDAGPCLRRLVAAHLPGDLPLDRHGFSGAVVSRAVSHRLASGDANEPLLLIGDPPTRFDVDGRALRAPLPAIEGLVITDDYAAAVQRKLYLYSAGHAATAYLGSLKGYRYVHTAIRDPEIRATVLAAMAEGQRGLAARHGAAVAGDQDDLEAVVRRFENAALNDTIARVARDPRRKLAADDRLVGPARLAAATGAMPEKLSLAVAAALCFTSPLDPSASRLHHEIETGGLADVLGSVCGLDPAEGLGRAVVGLWSRLAEGWSEGNLLLSLTDVTWAWSTARPAIAPAMAA